MASPQIHNLARHLLAFETARSAASDTSTDAIVRVVEELRVRLIRLVGIHGFRALLSRALALAKMETPSLHKVHICSDGFVKGFDNIEQIQAPGTAEQAGVALIAHLLELLVIFTGESLTLRIIHDIWPTASMDGENLITEEQP